MRKANWHSAAVESKLNYATASFHCNKIFANICSFTEHLLIMITDTLKCLSIGTPKAINFPFVSNEKLMFFRCPSIQAICNEAVIYLNFGTPKNNEFSIWNKWKIYYF